MSIQPGDRFGHLTVIEIQASGHILCKCDCGNEKVVPQTSLTDGFVKSCGCITRGRKPVPIAPGTRFGMLTVVSSDGNDILCRCDCGNEKTVNKYSLTHGNTKSCGCRGKSPKTVSIAPGTRFGKLTVISSEGPDVLCRCDCGNEKTVDQSALINGVVKSCGCSNRGRKSVPIAPGTRFGRLTVISSEGLNILCQCDCGNKTTVNKYVLAHGNTKSCGCLKRKIDV